MTFLLDTHVWIWAFSESHRLGPLTKKLLSDPASDRWVSSVSTMEIARLVAHNKLILRSNLRKWVEQSSKDLLLKNLELDHATALEAYQLPGTFHTDPADRLLVATARVHGWTLLTADRKILSYEHVNLIDAGS